MNIRELDGITERKAKQFEEKGIFTIEDLLKTMPKQYFNCKTPTNLTTNMENELACVVGTVSSALTVIGKDKNILRCFVKSECGKNITVLWFNQMFMRERLQYIKKDDKVIIFGRISYSPEFRSYTFSNPSVFSRRISEYQKIVPIYRKIKGMSEEYYNDCISASLHKVEAEDYLTDNIREEFSLCEYNKDFFRKIHRPTDPIEVQEVKKRLIFDDLFYFAKKLFKEQSGVKASSFRIKDTKQVSKVIENLSFKLTDDQHNTVFKIMQNAMIGKRVNALIQGDVGCGKTIVSFLCMFAFAGNGYQSVLMAPTQVLAKQHYDGLKKMADLYGYHVTYLHSGMKAKEKRMALEDIKSGKSHFIIGTHSVISKDVEYNNLALVITDEEHKFGVEQRDSLMEKASFGVHVITMSATPIPRTLAMTLYGDDKEIYTISQMPSGRKPVITKLESEDEVIFSFAKEQIREGRQCYVVCPFIKDSESEKFKDIESVEAVYDKIVEYFKDSPEVKIAVLTGKQNSSETEEILSKFEKNEIQMLISTTVIEVGVNVPNSSVIIIRSADRFGLAQLHQLRGRVGRGKYQSYCILSSRQEDNERLNVMCYTNDGFEIAEADLKQRGTGDLIGTKQSGDNKYVELMLAYPNFFLKIKGLVYRLFN